MNPIQICHIFKIKRCIDTNRIVQINSVILVICITKWVDSFIRTEIHLMDGKAKQSLQKQTLSENFPLINTTNSNPHVSSCYTLKPDFVDVILLSWV